VHRRVAREWTPARRGARAASKDARPGVAADLRRRTPRAAHKHERRGHGASARCGRDVVADPFCVADLLFEHTYLNFFE
jgi:hypothetical protein